MGDGEAAVGKIDDACVAVDRAEGVEQGRRLRTLASAQRRDSGEHPFAVAEMKDLDLEAGRQGHYVEPV